MGEFFNGWRRKAELVALAMACVLAVGWMRSSVDEESVDLVSSEPMTVRKLTSDEGLIGLELSTTALNARWIATEWFQYEHSSYWLDYLGRPQTDFAWRWQWLGLGFGKTRYFVVDRYFVVVPYWSLVLPLTLLSGWLLLIKPRPATSTKEPSRA